MDLKQYVPVGKDNGAVLTVITTGGHALKGTAWLETADDTTLSMTVIEGPSVGSTWVIAMEQVVALVPPPEPPPPEQRRT
jgi:hypothetical protein